MPKRLSLWDLGPASPGLQLAQALPHSGEEGVRRLTERLMFLPAPTESRFGEFESTPRPEATSPSGLPTESCPWGFLSEISLYLETALPVAPGRS